MSLTALKSSLPLRTVLAHYGLAPLPNDRPRCPFHEGQYCEGLHTSLCYVAPSGLKQWGDVV